MARLHDLWRRLRPNARTDPSDLTLLTRFVRYRDEEAFADLLSRHGPLVYAACRRHLPDPADVEDAFQATFLVLVKRAGRLGEHDTVGPWLHRVAVWTARRVRRTNARRLGREPARVTADTPALVASADAQLDLDDALLSLPEKYRVPVVLCHLQGWSRREAAEHLGCPEGTLSALLSRALVKLRKRLGTDPAVWLAVSATVPASLATATTHSANLYLSAAAVAPAVADLTRGVLRMFWVKKLTAVGLVLAALSVGVVGLHGPRGHRHAAAQPATKKVVTVQRDDPKVAHDQLMAAHDQLFRWAHGHIHAVHNWLGIDGPGVTDPEPDDSE